MNSFQRINLKRRLVVMYAVIILPLMIISLYLMYELNVFCRSYDAIVHNVTHANEYNLEFKNEFDSVMYQMVARSLTKNEVEASVGMKDPDTLISDAEKAFESLSSTTSSGQARDKIASIKKLLGTLRKRMEDINDSIDSEGSYDENMERLDTDIRILTQLIQERISEYIYFESESMEQIRRQMDEQRLRVMNVTIVAIIIALIASVLFYMLISRSITEPVANLELKLLQAQINPHFLYNTLDNIIWLAEDGRKEEVEDITSSLSTFFRTTLSGGRDFIRISEELSHIEAYLHIQRQRYRDILSYRIDVPDELRDYLIIKMTLQPVVENALYHGIKNKRGGGMITISGREEGNYVYLTVMDEGMGMDEERLSYLKGVIAGEIKPSADNAGFGMSNVAERMRLNYGNRCGINVRSEHGAGTEVEIFIPKSKDKINKADKNEQKL
ncbi:MAG: sensor histidine kinase [Lachnospiraceae bacterium]|nr:sensor histidine kinase [Lachnospiraceae bacterium]